MTERSLLPWKPSLLFLQRRWSSSTERDVHDQGVRKGEQQWTTETLQKDKEKMVQNDTITKRDLEKLFLQINDGKIDENMASERTSQSKKSGVRKNVIILSPGRGGSSFLGEIFNSNPHVLYWYEPLHTVHNRLFKFIEGKERKDYKETAIKVINSFLQCDFGCFTNSTLKAFSKSVHRKRSKALSSEYLCPVGKCMPLSKNMLSQTCNSKNLTVVKILAGRLPNNALQSLKELFTQPDRYEVKLIHLVRDPRAVMYSRVYSTHWAKSNSVLKLAIRFCNLTLDNIRFGLISPPLWLKNRFKVIRYEDLVLDTINIGKDLYRFVDIDWTTDVEEWINNHITGEVPARALNNPYSLFRRPSDVIEKWKSASKAFIKAVEAGCGDLMKTFGYEKFVKEGK